MIKDTELQDVFMKFHKKMSNALRKEAKSIPLTIPQLEALRFIIEQKGSNMRDIAAHLEVKAPSATTMIEHLHKKSLVNRRLDPADRRTVHVVPTAKALKFFSSFLKFKARVVGAMFAGLSENDGKQLTAILKKLI